MGKGDRKTARGKRFNSSYGNSRMHAASKPAVTPAAPVTDKAVAAKPVASKVAAKPAAASKPAVVKKAAKKAAAKAE